MDSQVEARQKVPEPRNNGSATEAKAGIEAGSGGSPGSGNATQRDLEQDRLEIRFRVLRVPAK